MSILSVVLNALGGAVGAWAAVSFLSKHLGDRLIEKLKAQYGRELAEMQNAFSIGATSHMAETAFDKHIEFCEEYVKALSNALSAIIQPGGIFDITELLTIRQKWVLWLTDEMESNLDQFEQRVSKIGSEAFVFDEYGEDESIQATIESIIGVLRKLLAIEELTTLRGNLVARSLKQ
jgi:hypothetical protein